MLQECTAIYKEPDKYIYNSSKYKEAGKWKRNMADRLIESL